MLTHTAQPEAAMAPQDAASLQREADAWHRVLSTVLDLASENPERFAALIVAASKLRDVLQPSFYRTFLADWLRIAREHELDAQQLAKLFITTVADLKPPAGNAGPGA